MTNNTEGNHNQNEKYNNGHDDSRMMWGMMILCALPVLMVLFGEKLKYPYNWIIFIFAVIIMIGHHFNFSKQKDQEEGKIQNSDCKAHSGCDEKNKGHGGCCG